MSMAALAWAFARPMTDPTAKAVLVALADHAGDDWTCWPSNRRLQDHTALSERAVRDALGRLSDMGAITAGRLSGKLTTYAIVRDWKGQTPAARAPVNPGGTRPRTPAAAAGTPARGAGTPAAGAPEPSRTVMNHDVGVSARAIQSVRDAFPDLDRDLAFPSLTSTASTGHVAGWIAEGADLDRVVLPVIADVCASLRRNNRGPPRSFAYFRQAVADAKAANTAGLPDARPPTRTDRSQQSRRNGGGGAFGTGRPEDDPGILGTIARVSRARGLV